MINTKKAHDDLFAFLATAFAITALAVATVLGISAILYHAPQVSSVNAVQQGANGPDSVSVSVTLVRDVIPSLSEQAVVYAELDACADLRGGVEYADTADAVGDQFGIVGQPRDFLVTTAVNTFCADQSPKVPF